MELDRTAQERDVRTLIVSDVHLGCRYAQVDHFLAYLRQIRPEQLFVLGDFLDGWKLRSRWRWTPVYSAILRRLFELAETGTEIFYTPGNHDAFLRCPAVASFLNASGLRVNIRDEFILKTLDGRRLLAFHGDRFDVVEMRHQWLSHLLTFAYEPLLSLNYHLHRLSRRRRSPYSLCAKIKHRVKSTVRFLSNFEAKLARYVRERGCDGVVCGHLHTPRIAPLDELTYFNSGDWIENCTALVEHHNGRIVLESFFGESSDGATAAPAPTVQQEALPSDLRPLELLTHGAEELSSARGAPAEVS